LVPIKPFANLKQWLFCPKGLFDNTWGYYWLPQCKFIFMTYF
jgi:hypothetical protein